MVQDIFDTILEEIGKALNIENLRLDSAGTCLIQFENGVEVYIEPHQKGESLLISTNLGEIPPGRYREDVFREALKANALPFPRYGTFAFSGQSDHLILFGMLSLRELNGEKVAAFLYPFLEKAAKWKNAIASSQVPLAETMATSKAAGPTGIFGLRS